MKHRNKIDDRYCVDCGVTTKHVNLFSQPPSYKCLRCGNLIKVVGGQGAEPEEEDGFPKDYRSR